jgi:hypothetical protein
VQSGGRWFALGFSLHNGPAKDVAYPIYSGQSKSALTKFSELKFNYNGRSIHLKLEFKPYQSIMMHITPEGKVKFIDITFVPQEPVVRPMEKQKTYFSDAFNVGKF